MTRRQRALLIGIVAGPWILFAFFYWVTPRTEDVRLLEIPPTGPITIAVTGDSLIFSALGDAERDPAFVAVRDVINGATFAITTLDLNLLGPDEAKSAGERPSPRWPFGTANEAQALRRLGFDALALANDHAGDYGVDGTLSTMRIISATGLLHAGTGADLAQARVPVFAGVPRRVALVSVSASSSPDARATATRAGISGRPGLNPLRYTADITVDERTFQTLRESVATLNAGPPAGERELTMFGTPVRKGDRTSVTFAVDANDEREILDEIKAAHETAAAVIVSLHAHEPSNDSDAPAEFVQQFARRAIDAGATLVVGHGPHRLRGVELYKGGAILYSLGNFIYQSKDLDFRAANQFDAGVDLYQAAIGAGTVPDRQASPPKEPGWWEGVVAVATVAEGHVSELRLVPVDLGTDKPIQEKGIPRKGTTEWAQAVLERISDLSQGFGATVQVEAGTGLVRGSPPKP